MLTDEEKVGCFVALTPTWNETAYFADYVLPMGHGSERHDTHSYEQYDGQWVGFRQPVLRAARERLGEQVTDTRQVNPGEVWEENEFWIELSWRIDPDGSTGHPPVLRITGPARAEAHRRRVLRVHVRELRPGAARAGRRRGADAAGVHAPLRGVRDRRKTAGPSTSTRSRPASSRTSRSARLGRVYTAAPAPASPNIVPAAAPGARSARAAAGRGHGRRGDPARIPDSIGAAGILVRHPGRLGLARARAARLHQEPRASVRARTGTAGPAVHLPAAHPDPHALSQRKWLDELSHTNPLWVHPSDAARLGIGRTGDLVRVETEIGYFVAKAWITEGIRPGVVACSHHMGRWKLTGHKQVSPGGMMATVDLNHDDDGWTMRGRRPGRAVPVGGSGHRPHLVDRHRRAPEPDVPRPPRPHLRNALLAPGGPGQPRPAR